MAFAQLAIASGNDEYAQIAKKTFDRILEKRSNPKGKWTKAHAGTRPMKDFRPADDPLQPRPRDRAAHRPETHRPDHRGLPPRSDGGLLPEDLGRIVENLSATDNSLIDCFEGRTINPGTSLEAMWFIMDLGKRLNRPELIDQP